MYGTLHFLGLQAVCPSLVLVKVGSSSTPREKDKALCSAHGAGMPSPVTAPSLQAGFLGQKDGQSPSPQDPALIPSGSSYQGRGPCWPLGVHLWYSCWWYWKGKWQGSPVTVRTAGITHSLRTFPMPKLPGTTLRV